MRRQASPTMVGGFVVVALVLLAISVVGLSAGRVLRTRANVIVYFEDAVGGLDVGAPVRFRGIEIGSVKDVRISLTGVALDPRHVRIPVLLEIDEDRLRAQGAKLVDLRDRRVVERLVDLGLRAKLASESLVGGVRYVELDVRPETPVSLVHDPRYPEFPSIPSPAEAIPDRIDRVLQKLEQVDVAGLTKSVRTTVDDADQLLRSPHVARAVARLDAITANLQQATAELSKTARELRPTIEGLKDTTTSVRKSSEALSGRIETTLRDISDAARSLRRLTDQLARDPGAILRGGKQ